ncbi:MAG: ABC transporter ATP-binding protein [Candidatus Omnitrophica bacterium]|nr:ABC transporter ATP-binding protein [Candidatus Omnitrophota bacterium]
MVEQGKQNSSALIYVENLTGGYARRKVVDNCSLVVTEGEFLGIIGPNGSGKTTLVRLLLGILKPFSGKIFYRGENVSERSTLELAREISFLPASLETTFPYTVEEFVALGYLPYSFWWANPRQEKKVIRESLSLVQALELASTLIRELSDGEKQRVFLAQALAQTPKLLILDEPTSHLDIGHLYTIMELLKGLNKRQGLTVICILHDLNLASDYCDRLILLRKGKIFQVGTPEEVLQPEIIEAVYHTQVLVFPSPVTGRPHLFGKKMES